MRVVVPVRRETFLQDSKHCSTACLTLIVFGGGVIVCCRRRAGRVREVMPAFTRHNACVRPLDGSRIGEMQAFIAMSFSLARTLH
jgi:hypothetical protein